MLNFIEIGSEANLVVLLHLKAKSIYFFKIPFELGMILT